MFAAQFTFRRRLPQLVNHYVQAVNSKKVLLRTKHEESGAISKATAPSNRLSKVQPQQSTVHPLPIIDTETPWSTIPEPPPDELAISIKKTTRIKDILTLIHTNKTKRMGEQHLLSICTKIHQFQADPSKQEDVGYIQNHQGFINLCVMLRKAVPMMTSTRSILKCLKMLCTTDVAPETRVVQAVLHTIRSQVNLLNVADIIFLDFLLRMLKTGPLVNALEIALPVVFETNLKVQLDTDNISFMCRALEYATRRRVSADNVKFIADGLVRSNPSTWTPRDVELIIRSLGRISHPEEDGLLPLLDTAVSHLATIVYSFSRNDLTWVLILMKQQYAKDCPFWYKESFCQAVAERAVQQRWPLKNAVIVARVFSKAGFFHADFLDYYAGLIKDSYICEARSISDLISCFAMANYRPQHLEAIVDKLESHSFAEPKPVRDLCNFAVLGVYRPKIIQAAFTADILVRAGANLNTLDWMQLSLAQRAVQIECPSYGGPWPSAALTKQAHAEVAKINLNVVPAFPLESALQNAAGGSSYVVSGLLTKFGHFIDHMILLDPHGFPVKIKESITKGLKEVRYVEDFEPSRGCRRLLIRVLRLGLSAHVANGGRMRGVYQLDLRTLQRAGYDVVPILLERWQSLLDHEKIPFLMRVIREKGSIAYS